LAATSRDTVETARSIDLAIVVKLSPRSKPARMSSLSSIDKRAGDGFHSDADSGRGCRTSTLLTACREQ
jgi:hypothetical protein